MEQSPAPVPEIEAIPADRGVWGPWATAGLGAVILFAFFAVLVVIVVIIAVVLAVTHLGEAIGSPDIVELTTDLVMDRLGLLIAVAGIGSYSAGTLLILAAVKVRRGRGIGDYLGLKRVGWKTVFLCLVITGVFLAAVVVIGELVNIQDEDTGILVDTYKTAVWPALFWIAVVVFAPIFEEPFARGFLFEGFRHSRLGLAGAIILTSLVWTALHVGYGLFSLGTIFVFGLVLGYVRYRTGSLWSTILMHGFYNLVGMIAIAFSAA
jgi:uncharacterized protein